ncbi:MULTISPECIES: hypothetical protein [Cyanophyceae]|uniref:hypothetical protein n=1 Tax=Cyanophyceae TaxID=3028117 RepID=UPI00059EC4A1|nr:MULTISPECIES: hypothetical protein [Cyanophyceae]SMH34519.1 hypothetical protein SAMN06272755_0579 [Picosynechococcus sp. OG1]SMQ84619.1 hypothetical protein SAMN06272774_2953 [Synechococcus sp. 7002]
MFATLVGTNRQTNDHIDLLSQLIPIAKDLGFEPPDLEHEAVADQGSLAGWSSELRGPSSNTCEFFLAVTAPNVPGMSPIHPFRKTFNGPMFAVVVNDGWFLVSRSDHGDVTEFKTNSDVVDAFANYLEKL